MAGAAILASAGAHDVGAEDTSTAVAPEAFRVLTREAGVHRVTFERLAEVGLPAGGVPSAELSVDHLGEPLPIHVEDGGDGVFGPGDAIELVAERLVGMHGQVHEKARFDVYWLRLRPGERMTDATVVAGSAGDRGAARARLLRLQTLEDNELMVRLSGHDVGEDPDPELWFWSKLTYLDRSPTRLPLDLAGWSTAEGDAQVRLRVRGISSQRTGDEGLPDHTLRAVLGATEVGQVAWSGKEPVELELPPIPPAAIGDGGGLELTLPERRRPDEEDPIVDVVVLGAAEVSYPHDGRLRDGGQLRLRADGPGGLALLEAPEAGAVVYLASGRRAVLPGGESGVEVGPREGMWLAAEGAALEPVAVEPHQASDWAAADHRADYLIIAHRSLVEAVRPLAEHHRADGLAVEVVDVADLYDEFNHGIVDPIAIRRFIARAREAWRPPAPRYVLLVGDASWDIFNATIDDARYANWTQRQLFEDDGRFRAKNVEEYLGSVGWARNLVPAPSYHTSEGHAASDNWYVAVEGDDVLPDLAIGRLPVATPAEVEAIVRKTVDYSDGAPVGPWRRRALWLTNEDVRFQKITDDLAALSAERGLEGTKVYPSASEASNEEHQATVLQALAEGQYLVHFVGHGGRFIWRTGPTDLDKKRDLFTLEHLDELPASRRLPVVFSMTCHSGPFDHPSADSIGEKFLRVPDRGAIAVIAAAWRTTPSPGFSTALLEEFIAGTRIGDAFVAGKRKYGAERLVATYNLFGDPAVRLAVPRSIPLTVGRRGDSLVLRTDPGDTAPAGHVSIELLDGLGSVLWERTEELDADGARAPFEVTDAPPESRHARLYFWSETERWDALAVAALPGEAEG